MNLPLAGCEAGKTYDVHVYAIRYGAPIKVATTVQKVQVAEKSDPDASIIISMKDTYTTGERVRIHARYEGADEEKMDGFT